MAPLSAPQRRFSPRRHVISAIGRVPPRGRWGRSHPPERRAQPTHSVGKGGAGQLAVVGEPVAERRVVGAQAFEGRQVGAEAVTRLRTEGDPAVAVERAVVVDVQGRVGLVVQLAVDPDLRAPAVAALLAR